MRLSELDYDLPEELIAQEPLARRDEARLLVLNRKSKSVEHSRFYKLVRHLREGDLIVLNDTRVLPARLFAQKESGGRVELLMVRPASPAEGPAGAWLALIRKHMQSWIVVATITLAMLSCVGCGSQSRQPTALEEQWSDPIATTFEHCGDLFTAEANSHECVLTDRRERGYDVVEDKVTCRQQTADVNCALRPGPGAGPDLNWMNYKCSRTSRQCRITGGELGFTSASANLFAEHNAGLISKRTLQQPETR
jgi:Queuosine biosynthesis protein